MKKIAFNTLVLCLLGFIARAQYTGGSGSGAALAENVIYYLTSSNSWSPADVNGLTSTAQQTISVVIEAGGSGTITSATTVEQVTVNPGGTLATTATLTTDSMIILADNTGYGMYKGNQQNVRIQQYVANAGWHSMALPVGGNLDQFGLVNTAIHPNTRNLYAWDAATGQWSDVVGAGNGSSVANSAGSGYNVYVGAFGVVGAGAVVEAKGQMFTSATPSLNYFSSADPNVEGWNLIGNPFTCALDFTQLGRTNVNNAFSVWDPVSQSYKDNSALSTDNIAPMQAFWVKANAAGPSISGMDMTTNAAVVSIAPAFYKTTVADRFYVQVVAQNNPLLKDEILIGMVPGTSDGLDSDWDAPTRLNPASVPTLMMVNQNEQLAHNAIDFGPQHQQTKHLPLYFYVAQQGDVYGVTLYDSLLANMYTIVLEDQKTGVFHDLATGTYVFTNDTAAKNRFVLHLAATTVSVEDLEWATALQYQLQGSNVVVFGRTPQDCNVAMYNMNGQQVRGFLYPAGTQEYSVSLLGLPVGMYILQIGDQTHKLVLTR